MITATGRITVNPDPKNPRVAVLDINDEWDDPGNPHSRLHLPLAELLNQEVFVLVLPKDEMLALCECGDLFADHCEFTNWDRDVKSSAGWIQEPNFEPGKCRGVLWAGHNHPGCETTYCKCKAFKLKVAA